LGCGSDEKDSSNYGRDIGTTRARVSHFMNKFRKLGLPTMEAFE
jgi:hypothetical protein